MQYLSLSREYVVKVIITIFFYIIVSCALSVSNRIGIYLVYFMPIMIIPLGLQVYIDAYVITNYNSRLSCSIITLFLTGIICLPIFFGVFFGIFQPTQSLALEQVENCQVTGIAKMSQPSYEVYSILYVDFQKDSQNFLGYACMSDQVENLNSYLFIYGGDEIPCDDVGASFDTPENKLRILNDDGDRKYDVKRKRRVLRQRGVCKQMGKSKGSYYNFSKVKFPSWFCLSQDITFEELTKSKTCYVNYFPNSSSAYSNSKNRLNLKEVKNFALTLFNPIPFFPKGGYFVLILFTYLPLLLNFYFLSSLITFKIFKILKHHRHFKMN